MKKIRSMVLAGLFAAVFASAAAAQKAPAKPKTRATPKPTPVSAEVKAAKEKVSIQRSNVDMFVDVLGPIAQSIESLDGDVKNRKASKSSIDANEANKQKVIVAIRNLRTGLVNLETEFRTKTALSKYLTHIQGISDLAAESEDLALAGKFVASKDPLRNASLKLNATFAAMPK